MTSSQGHWSAWITGDVLERPPDLFTCGSTSSQLVYNIFDYGPALTLPAFPESVIPEALEQMEAMRSEGGRAGSAGEFVTTVLVSVGQSWIGQLAFPGSTHAHYSQASSAQQGLARYDGSANSVFQSDTSAVLGGLTEGVDYGPNPDTGQVVDYEASQSTLIGWADWSVVVDNLGAYTRYENSPNGNSDPGAVASGWVDPHPPFRVRYSWWVDRPPVADPSTNNTEIDATTPWPGPDAGTQLTVHSFDATPTNDSPSTEEVVIPLSQMGAVPYFTLFAQPDYMGSGPLPITDFAGPGTIGWDVLMEYRSVVVHRNIDNHTINYTNLNQRGTVPTVRYQAPRWRYWVPAPSPAPITYGPMFLRTTASSWTNVERDARLHVCTNVNDGVPVWHAEGNW